jgi:hypothetical protein
MAKRMMVAARVLGMVAVAAASAACGADPGAGAGAGGGDPPGVGTALDFGDAGTVVAMPTGDVIVFSHDPNVITTVVSIDATLEEHDVTTRPANVMGIAGAPDGSLVVTGHSALEHTNSEGLWISGPPVLTRFDAQGATAWSVPMVVEAMAVDAQGDIYLSSASPTPVRIGGGTIATDAHHQSYIVKLAPDGTYLWSVAFGNGSGVPSLAVTPDGVVGIASDMADFEVAGVHVEGAYFAEFDADGTPITAASIGPGLQLELSSAVVADANGFVTAASNAPEGLVARWDLHGAQVWQRTVQGLVALAGDRTGSVYVGVAGAAANLGASDPDPDGALVIGTFDADGNLGAKREIAPMLAVFPRADAIPVVNLPSVAALPGGRLFVGMEPVAGTTDLSVRWTLQVVD